MRFWVRGHPLPGAPWSSPYFAGPARTRCEVAKEVRDCCPACGRSFPVRSCRADLRPFANDRQQRQGRAGDPVHRLRSGGDGDLPVPGRATDTLIPAVALPLSLLLTFMAMNMLGYSLDNLSLMALTLAIGFLVDDAIVFLENTVRLMERGRAPSRQR